MVLNLKLAALLSTLIGSTVILFWRRREARSPVTLAKIIAPPLGMSTGFSMFAYAPMRIPVSWALTAMAIGAVLFAVPLVRLSRLVIRENAIYLQHSRAFLLVLGVLVLFRLGLKNYIEQYLTVFQTGSLFFCLAFGMIVRWRVGMVAQFRKLQEELRAHRG